MTDHTEAPEATPSPNDENEKIVLAYASLLWLAVRQTLRASGAAKDPKRLAEIEAQIEAGTANLGIWVQGDPARVFLSGAPLEAALHDPFKGTNALRVSGPLILSREQLAQLGDGITLPPRSTFN